MLTLNGFLFMINILHLLINIYSGQSELCLRAKTCNECVSASANCFWCADENFENGLNENRCNTKQNLLQFNCAQNKIIEVKNEMSVKQDKNFAETIGATVQLKPQKYEMSLRAHSEMTIPIHFRQANDYPLDLYYLMDLSCTMRKHKKILANVGKKIADKMKETTKNFQIGFGSFVDKTVMPYCAYKIEKLQCEGEDGEPPYSFQHRMSLKSDANEFQERVGNAKTSGNTDAPEGTLDALMQVLVCKEEIGWRDQSSKIVVVATDEQFHYAGDGKLGGILVPNDGKCHLLKRQDSEIQEYTHWELLDYPSMHHIAQIVNKKTFNIVFTVDRKVKNVYETLVDIIGTNARTAELDNDANSVVKLIDDVYRNISSSVEFRIETIPDNIEIELFSKCENSINMRRTKCSFKGKPTITFEAKIKMKSCPKDKSMWNQKIKIGLTNINESVEIDLHMNCECDCEKPENIDQNSDQCSKAGTYACGICSSCNGIRTGYRCECDPEKPINASDPESHCKKKGESRSCSDKGKCNCAKCQCSEKYSGDFCEFDDMNCYQSIQSVKCNGNGKCIRGRCECNQEYTGNFCDCTKSNLTCIAPNNSSVCSEMGDCRCGRCDCRSSSRGKYCQKCPNCEALLYCEKIISCVPEICQELKNKENCTQMCTQLDYKIINQLDELSNSSSEVFRYQCQTRTLDNNCDVIFTYERMDGENDDELSFKITKASRICKQKADLVITSVSVIAGVILVGLALLLIWKLITEYLDRKEFARFEKEINKANWDQSENPLYKEAKSTFTNPTFGLREKSTKKD